MNVAYILRYHRQIQYRAERELEEARMQYSQERERIYARFGGAITYEQDKPSGTPDPDAKIAAAMDELIEAERAFLERIEPAQQALTEVAAVAYSVTRMPEPYRALFVALYYEHRDANVERWKIGKLKAEGMLILKELLNDYCNAFDIVIK